MARSNRRRCRDGSAEHTEVAIPQPPTAAASVRLSLPSIDDRLEFVVTLFFEARWDGADPAPPAMLDIARHGIAMRADEVARRHPLTAQERLRCDLNTGLHRWGRVPDTDVMARGRCVSIDTDAELLTAVAAREDAARRRLVGSWADEQRIRQTERTAGLLLDPLRATAAWFSQHQDKPEQVVETAKQFKELRAVLAPEQDSGSEGALLDELLMTMDEPDRLRTLFILRKLFVQNERHDLAARLVFPDGEAVQS